MPHNVSQFDGSIHVLDLPGHLRFNNLSVQGTFPAFTRGLSYGRGYFIGQSKNRNHSKVMGVSNNISIDCGIIIFDAQLNVLDLFNYLLLTTIIYVCIILAFTAELISVLFGTVAFNNGEISIIVEQCF